MKFQVPSRPSLAPYSRPEASFTEPVLSNSYPHSADKQQPGLKARLLARWHRFRHRCILRAIRTYSFEKHVRSRYFRPFAGPATLKAHYGHIERNKFPFHMREHTPGLGQDKASLPIQPALTDTEALMLPDGWRSSLTLPESATKGNNGRRSRKKKRVVLSK